MVALDRMEKAARVRLLQVEFNDRFGVCIKVSGQTDAVQASVDAGQLACKNMRVEGVACVLPRPEPGATAALLPGREFNPLIEQEVVLEPSAPEFKEANVADQASFSIGIIETQGLTAALQAVDVACKAANVEVLAREKLGGGYIAVVMKGDVAAVKTAVEAGQAHVHGLGVLIAAHVIAKPSVSVLALLQQR